MKKIFILCLGIGLLFSYRGFGQVGEQVENVDILNMNNDTIPLPFLGQKNLLIFYADPARKETAGTDAQLYVDPNSLLSNAWHLPGANDNFTVIFVNKDRIIEFYKAGQLSDQEQRQVIELIDKYGGK